MKTLALLITTLFFMGCGPKDQNTYIAPELAPYLSIYLSLAPNSGSLSEVSTIDFGDPGEGRSGVCTHKYSRKFGQETSVRKVIIRREDFGTAMGKRAFYHELGHCLHGLSHTDNPDDVMSDALEYEDREGYWKENLTERLRVMFREYMDAEFQRRLQR